MNKEDKKKIQARIIKLKQQQIGLKNESGRLHQALAEVKEAFDQLQARIEELRMLLPEGKNDS